ncbi:Uncharacterised protein [Yersinia enterocolitica]|nr:Uncharacterised protein [Yersinia enterocolitica]
MVILGTIATDDCFTAFVAHTGAPITVFCAGIAHVP